MKTKSVPLLAGTLSDGRGLSIEQLNLAVRPPTGPPA